MEHDDRRAALEEFASGNDEQTRNLPAATQVFAAPAERVFGAQAVAVKRDEAEIFRDIKKLAAVAGDDWYYRFPVKSKVKNEATGKDEFVTTYIEGPSIKCANNVSRLYGNCDVDVRVMDAGDSYMFYARFMDLQTGYSLVRPFRQRKNQRTMKTDAGRAEDIVFQIGASKAIRNVICNALEMFAGFAMEEAKTSVIEKVGKNLPAYKDRVIARLKDLHVELPRVERLRARPLKDWTASDVAMTISEIQSINDGMAIADDTWPQVVDRDEKTDTSLPPTSGTRDAAGRPASENAPANGAPASEAGAGQKAAQQTAQVAQRDPPAEQEATATQQGADQAPKDDAAYDAYARAYIEAATDADALDTKWKSEKKLRNDINVFAETRDELQKMLATKLKALRDAKGN